MEKLPSEIMCVILSFLDKKSRKSATATCQLWFDVIRNSNSSNHICYKGSVEKFRRRIAKLKWDWKGWPALKTFEFQGYCVNRDLRNDLSIDFKQCPTLEIVLFGAFIDIANVFLNCPRNVAIIRKFAFNPQLDVTQFGVDHIWSLDIWGNNDEVFKLINENVKGIRELTLNNLSYLNNLVCKDALLELCFFNSSPELKIAGWKKLKTLKVCKFAQLDNFVGIDALLELSFTNVSGRELKEYDLSNIAKHFKNLQKCEILIFFNDLIQPEEYAEIVQDVFQNSATRIEIVFSTSKSLPTYLGRTEIQYSWTYLTKEPFQRCVVKKENSVVWE